MPNIALRVDQGALCEVPPGMHEPTEHGRNWLAVIGLDKGSPGGFSRRFLPRAHGQYFYVVDSLETPCAVEFGADTVGRKTGRKLPRRWYGLAVNKTDTELVLVECPTGTMAARVAELERRKADQRPDGRRLRL